MVNIKTESVGVYDFTLHALDKRLQKELDAGNWTHARTLTTVMGMYTKNMLDVYWENGEPSFALTSKGEEIVDEVSLALERMSEEDDER